MEWDITPIKIYSGSFETSLNGPGFSITLCNLSNVAKEIKTSVDELMELLGADTKAPSWPNVSSNYSTRRARIKMPQVDIEKEVDVLADEDIKGRSLLA
jgi:dihydroxyacetone kinase